MKKILSVFILILIFIFIPKKSFASDFSASYNVTYNINTNASTHVNFAVALTNNTSQYYASAYQISVGFMNIYNVQASDPGGPIAPVITKTPSGNTVKLTFNNQVVGLGNTLNFNLSFDTNEVSQSLGHVFEINIPGVINQSDFQNANIYVIFPSSLGNPAFIKPDLPLAEIQQAPDELHFTSSQLGESGISITFGNYQLYNFSLEYHLQNSNLFPIQTQIALPPSTNYQDVLISSMTPKPINVAQDQDGNYLATYYLSPSELLNVKVTGVAKIYLNPRTQPLLKKEYALYLKPQPYWQVNNPKIQALAKSLKTPYAIYNYASSHLSYDYQRVISSSSRLGAINVLQNPTQAVCLEFSDLFVTLARAAGIPSREVDGFAYTNNPTERPLSLSTDILHSWPEYYDSQRQTWIMVDPTWGNTTGGVDYFNVLDFDHFAFAIEGQESNYPVPAGGYKLQGQNIKDVNVTIGQTFNSKPELTAVSNFPQDLVAGLPVSSSITFSNTGNAAIVSQKIRITSTNLNPTTQNLTIPTILPFAIFTLPVSFKQTSFLTKKDALITVSIGQNKFSQKIKIIPFFMDQWFITGVSGIIVIFTIIFIATSKPKRIFSSDINNNPRKI